MLCSFCYTDLINKMCKSPHTKITTNIQSLITIFESQKCTQMLNFLVWTMFHQEKATSNLLRKLYAKKIMHDINDSLSPWSHHASYIFIHCCTRKHKNKTLFDDACTDLKATAPIQHISQYSLFWVWTTQQVVKQFPYNNFCILHSYFNK
jgi:hypothetical protein